MSSYQQTEFSDKLEVWLKGKQPKTLTSLIKISEDKSFAVIILFLMLLPALPLPTAGVTHVFEVITILLSLELIIGLKTIWLPRRAQKISLEKFTKGKAVTAIIKRVRWLEKHSSPRGKRLFDNPLTLRIAGLIIIGFTLAALLAPPFSGLDTLPSLGVVIVALSLILEDAIMLTIGIFVGAVGAGITYFLGSAAIHFLHKLI